MKSPHREKQAPPLAPLAPLAFRPVAPPDEPFLLRLYAATRAEELARTGWDEASREAFLRAQFRARAADHAGRFPGAEHAIVTADGREVGVWMVWRGQAEIRLINIELLPAHRGRGLGTVLLRGLIAESHSTGLPLRLSVREDNVAAIRLYRRLRFAAEAREAGYLKMRHKSLC